MPKAVGGADAAMDASRVAVIFTNGGYIVANRYFTTAGAQSQRT